MVKIIDGKNIAERIKDRVAKEIYDLAGPRPNLAIILIGERPDSKLYVSLKEREAVKVGIDTHLYLLDEDISELDLMEVINCLNDDPLIDAILIQLPLPNKFDTDQVIRALDPNKDADRFHPDNIHDQEILSPVFNSVLESLREAKCMLENKRVAVLYNSEIFGQGLKSILEAKQAKVDLISSADKKLSQKTQLADVVITALGKPHFVTGEMIKEGAIIIDIGITKQNKEVLGDVDFASVKDKASYITPVPGGIGPMTIAMLFQNTLALYKKKKAH